MTTPVYSVENECQDCCKCIRHCPVKAIQVVDGHARVMPERCIACSQCVTLCPSGAKRVRDDVGQAKSLLKSGKKVFLSLAPSYVSEFPDASRLVAACEKLGFSGVSETALGAQQVSAQLGRMLEEGKQKLYLSSACPVAVDFVRLRLPHLAESITPLLSPLLAHGKLLRREYGEKIGIVFVGPCIAKKREIEHHRGLIDVALTFDDLRRWFEQENIVLGTLPDGGHFVPKAAEEGAVYPIEGGMNEVTRANCLHPEVRFISLSGLAHLGSALGALEPRELPHPLCIELLACEGGCIGGPGIEQSAITSRLLVQDRVSFPPEDAFPRPVEVELAEHFEVLPTETAPPDEASLREVLQRIGKPTANDELNCGGCGYESCREFAGAILHGKAEATMCVSYMRQLAQKKVNILFRTMPFGVVLLDQDQQIIECNEQFARVVGNGAVEVYQACPGMEGADLKRILPFPELFQHVLDTTEEILRRNVRFENRLLSLSIFNIEPHQVLGALLLDVTETESRREEIVSKARLVIKNTLANAQEIAFLIGKNAAESECILNSVIEGFVPDEEEV